MSRLSAAYYRNTFYCTIIISVLISCTGNDNTQSLPAGDAQVVKAEGYIVPKDSILPPEVTAAGKPSGTVVGRIASPGRSLTAHQAFIPKRIEMKEPVIRTIGKNGMRPPQVLPARGVKKVCELPEKVLVKEPYFKDVNPSNFFYFGKQQGLRHDQIRCMIQDKLGNIWLGTDNGLTKYDGKHYYHYTISQGLNHNVIMSLFQDSEGNIWFSTFEGGVTKFDGIYLTTYTTDSGLPYNIVNSIFEDSTGSLWFGTKRGLAKFDGENFTIFRKSEGLPSSDIRDMILDDNGRMWIATYGGGVSIYDGATFTNYTDDQGLPQNLIFTLFKDIDGNIWISTSYAGLVKFDGKNFYHYTVKEGLGSNSVRTIVQDENENYWFGNGAGTITRFDGNSFRILGKEDGLVAESMRCSIIDINGNMWFGTRGAGLIRFDGVIFSHLTQGEGLSNNRVVSMLEDRYGNIWLGTYGGYVTIYTESEEDGISRTEFKKFGKAQGLQDGYIFSMTSDKNGNIWFGTDMRGLAVYDGSSTYTYTTAQGLVNNSINTVYEDRLGNIWIANFFAGVTKFDGKNFVHFTKKQGLIHNQIISILHDSRDNYWFGSVGGGLTSYDGKTFTHYNKETGFPGNIVSAIVEDREGVIWFGTDAGIVRFDGQSFITYGEESGLRNVKVMSLLLDNAGNLWAGTRQGLHVIKRRYLERIDTVNKDVYINSYDVEDGFLGADCNAGALLQSSGGTIWIGTMDRLTAFHGDNYSSVSIPPNIKITGIQLFNEEIPWPEIAENMDTTIQLHNGVRIDHFKFKELEKWYSLPVKLKLSHNHNYITINYIGITHSQMANVRYQYKLDGLDKDWNIPTERTEVSYGNLNPGRYVFRVKAVSGDGEMSDEASYSFTVKPPWWNTWWFYILAVIAAASLFYTFVKRREYQLNADRELLQKKVDAQTSELTDKNTELHKLNLEKDKLFSIIAHDLRGPFSSFIGLTRLMADDLDIFTKDQIREFAEKMNNSASNLYNLLENLLQWSRMQQGTIPFNPKPQNLLAITSENMEWINQYAREKNIAFTVDIPEKLVVTADSNMLQTIIRNLVSNAIKFTPGGGFVTLSAKSKPKRKVEIVIADNGIGMEREMIENLFKINIETGRAGTNGEPSTGLGLLICKEFIERHNGTLEVESEKEKGSRFIVTLPL